MTENLLPYLGLAFAGGLILNIMPCVLPVLTMKVFHAVEQSEMSPAAHRRHGLAYAAGVVSTFVVLAAFLLVLRAGGEQVGWGIHFSNPAFVAAMTAVVFLFGLNGLGVFEFRVALTGGPRGEGLVGSFVNGVVASIMSTPCSAPMLGTAAGFALGAAAPWETMAIFVTIGAGLASPYVLFSFIPGAGKLLPKPGAWMETFKHLMGFTLIGAAVWLFGVLMRQVSLEGARAFLAFLLVLAVAAWAIGRFAAPHRSARSRRLAFVVSAALVTLGGATLIDMTPRAPESSVGRETGPSLAEGEIDWRSFDSDVVMRSLAANRPVFIDYTADWCANCKTNERLFIEVDRIRQVFDDTQILPMKADLTVENDEIMRWLEPFPYSGIPVYAIYLPDQTVDLLPQAITTELLAGRLLSAAERF